MDCTGIHFQQMLRSGMRVVPVGGDDNHRMEDVGKAWLMVKAEELSYEALIDAFEKGHCYASEGPEIHSIILEDGKIKVKTSPASYITVPTQGRVIPRRGSRGGPAELTEASFDFNPEKWGSFFRIEVWDEKGFRAFSSAFYIPDILEELKKQEQS